MKLNRIFLILPLLVFVNVQTEAAKAKDPMDVKAVREKIRSIQNEIGLLKANVTRLEAERNQRKSELSRFEKEFEQQFQRVMVPLLHWPKNNFRAHSSSWLQNQHEQFVLLKTRERIAREPLVLIANRELQLKESETQIGDAAIMIQQAESKHSLLRLQLDELQYLHKRLSKTK